MAVLSPAAHRTIDFVTVALFAIAPTLMHLTGTPAYVAYALAVVHLAMTLVTQFPGRSGFVPMRLHAVVEILVGCALIGYGITSGDSNVMTLYGLLGGIILLVVLLSGMMRRSAPTV